MKLINEKEIDDFLTHYSMDFGFTFINLFAREFRDLNNSYVTTGYINTALVSQLNRVCN